MTLCLYYNDDDNNNNNNNNNFFLRIIFSVDVDLCRYTNIQIDTPTYIH